MKLKNTTFFFFNVEDTHKNKNLNTLFKDN